MFGQTARQALAVATEAKRIAELGDQRHEDHEALCTERWEQLRDSVRGMMAAMENKHEENKRSLGKLWWAILIGMGVTICGMAGLIVTLALMATGHGHA